MLPADYFESFKKQCDKNFNGCRSLLVKFDKRRCPDEEQQYIHYVKRSLNNNEVKIEKKLDLEYSAEVYKFNVWKVWKKKK